MAFGFLAAGEDRRPQRVEYKKVADQNQAADEFGKRHVTVVSFDGVTNPAEIAEDLILLAA
jgi:hypothetical protein